MAKDLVCNMEVDEKNPDTISTVYKGKTYYFCTPLCKVQFETEPERYIAENDELGNNRKHYGKGNPSV